MLHSTYRYMISSIITYFFVPVLVAKITNCDEGHLCSSNRECCSQGCCPTQPRAATDHVLNLFFINHWYFWCVVVAVILAILCAYSLWKKRRQFCGWRSSDHHIQSEGDSAGSCYAPPQYSRCSSFHHPPPPYTEVTSKPDLYPLVFTCNSENGKNGTSYLMVQYFRNYIVRPVGSISATSTIDSLSSSFICNANEANTLVPPPYSRATSPETAINSHFQQHFMVSKSASQTALPNENSHLNEILSNIINNDHTVSNSNNSKGETQVIYNNKQTGICNEDENLILRENSLGEINSNQFCNILHSKGGYSDIFVSKNYNKTNDAVIKNNSIPEYSLNNIKFSNRKKSTSQFSNSNNNPIYNSCGSVGGISITVPVAADGGNDYRNLDVFRKSLETCCQILQKQHYPSSIFTNDANLSLINDDENKKIENGLPSSYLNSTTCSVFSSLANIGTPSSPPQATSPTCDEMKDVLENIRQLEIDDVSVNDLKFESKNSIKKRPSALLNKTKISRQNKSVYIPIWNPNINSMKSPVSGNNFFRGRKHWISRSAPTTPGTTLPQQLTENLDQSPLLQQHDEENE